MNSLYSNINKKNIFGINTINPEINNFFRKRDYCENNKIKNDKDIKKLVDLLSIEKMEENKEINDNINDYIKNYINNNKNTQSIIKELIDNNKIIKKILDENINEFNKKMRIMIMKEIEIIGDNNKISEIYLKKLEERRNEKMREQSMKYDNKLRIMNNKIIEHDDQFNIINKTTIFGTGCSIIMSGILYYIYGKGRET